MGREALTWWQTGLNWSAPELAAKCNALKIIQIAGEIIAQVAALGNTQKRANWRGAALSSKSTRPSPRQVEESAGGLPNLFGGFQSKQAQSASP